MPNPKRYLVTGALPYANGRLHIGHIAGAYLPADTCVRFLRLKGRDAAFICGSDENGVPITLSAAREKVTPQEIVDRYYAIIAESFKGMGIEFDIYHRTHTDRHAANAQAFFKKLLDLGHVEKGVVEQPFCHKCQMFLPDRYIEGICPHCGAAGARGDQCEACGRVVDATKLKEPYCVICKSREIEIKSTEHWFFRLDKFQDKLRAFLDARPHFRESVKRFSYGLLEQGLQRRCITRDISWGVPVPLPEDPGAAGKVLYVWFDAPIGYLSFTQEFFAQQGKASEWEKYWKDPETHILHFIGKDNIVFHSIIWPAMLMGQGEMQLPHDVVANEFLNIKGAKTSTSRNYAVWIDEYLKAFPADPLRYYLTAIAPEGSDSDFSWEGFQARNNNELADTLGNFMQRCLVFCKKYFEGKVPEAGTLIPEAEAMLKEIDIARKEIGDLLEEHHYKAALERMMKFAKGGNQYLETEQPWKTRKTDMAACGRAVHVGLRVVEALSVLMAPFLPFSSKSLRKQLALAELKDGDWDKPWLLAAGHAIGEPEVLFRKFEDKEIAPHVETLAGRA